MDAATLFRKVQRRFGDSNQVFITEADVIDWINDGQQQIAKETKCLSVLQTQNASTFPIAIPADFLKIERLLYRTAPIPYTDVEDLDNRNLDLTIQDTPIVYYINEDKICLYPDPPSTDTTPVNLYYSKIPATLTAIGNPLTIPVAFHEDLVTFVLIRAHERNENWKAVEVLTAEYQNALHNRLEDTNQPDDTYAVVRDDPWDSQIIYSDAW